MEKTIDPDRYIGRNGTYLYDKDIKDLKKEIFDNLKPGASILVPISKLTVDTIEEFHYDRGDIYFMDINKKRFSIDAVYFATEEQRNRLLEMAKAARKHIAFGEYDAYPIYPLSTISYD